MPPPRVAIVVVDFNGLQDTRKCLDSIAAARFENTRTIVIDNGSTPATAPAIAAEYAWAHVIRREVNGGWAGGNNEGIKAALADGADWAILLNNDTTVAPDLVPRMLAAAASNPGHGVLGPVINFMDEPGAVMTDGVVFNPPGPPGQFFARLEVPPRREPTPRVVDVDIVNGCALMISADTLRRIGLVDERFFLIHEESDLCLRAVAAGIRCGVVAETLVWHKGSSSFKRTGSRHQRYYDSRNLVLLLRKHARTHRRGRSAVRSWFEYFRYVYYRWSIEREAGEKDAAAAVVEGVLDGVAGRHGPYERGPRSCSGLLDGAFSTLHRLKGGIAGG
jgi:GT2 family glycosyltransferase